MDLPVLPACEAEEEMAVDEYANAVGPVVEDLAVVAGVPEVDDSQHIIKIY